MGIALTDDHRELGEVARSFLTAQKARWAARELLDAAEEARPPFWAELAELGWLGLHVDEAVRRLRLRTARVGRRDRRTRPGGGARTVRADGRGLRRHLGGRHRRAEGPPAARSDRRISHRGSRFRR